MVTPGFSASLERASARYASNASPWTRHIGTGGRTLRSIPTSTLGGAGVADWRDLLGLEDEELQRARSRYETLSGQAAALGLEDAAEEPEGWLTKVARILDYPRALVFSAGKEIADAIGGGGNGASFEDFRRQLDERMGFGDTTVLQFQEDDSFLERAGKAVGAFLGDVVADPLSYVSFGAGAVGKKAMADVVSRTVAERAASTLGEEVASKWAARSLAGRAQRQIAEEVGDEASANLAEALKRLNLENAGPRAGAEQIGAAAAERFLTGGATGLRQFLRDEFGEAGTKLFKSLPSDVRGGVRVRVPFAYDQGVRRTINLGGGGGVVAEALGLSPALRVARNLQNQIRASRAARQLSSALGGAKGDIYGKMIHDLIRTDPDDLTGVSYHFYQALRKAERSARSVSDDLTERTRRTIGMAHHYLDTAPDSQAARDAFTSYFQDPAMVREVSIARGFEIDEAGRYYVTGSTDGMTEEQVRGLAAAMLFHDTLGTLAGKARQAGVRMGELDNYVIRVLTEEAAERKRALKASRKPRVGKGGGRYDPTASREKFLEPFFDEQGTLQLRHLTPDEANARVRQVAEARGVEAEDIFSTDPFEMMSRYTDALSSIAYRTTFARMMIDSGAVVRAGKRRSTSFSARKLQEAVNRLNGPLARMEDVDLLSEAAVESREMLQHTVNRIAEEPDMAVKLELMDSLAQGLQQAARKVRKFGQITDGDKTAIKKARRQFKKGIKRPGSRSREQAAAAAERFIYEVDDRVGLLSDRAEESLKDWVFNSRWPAEFLEEAQSDARYQKALHDALKDFGFGKWVRVRRTRLSGLFGETQLYGDVDISGRDIANASIIPEWSSHYDPERIFWTADRPLEEVAEWEVPAEDIIAVGNANPEGEVFFRTDRARRVDPGSDPTLTSAQRRAAQAEAKRKVRPDAERGAKALERAAERVRSSVTREDVIDDLGLELQQRGFERIGTGQGIRVLPPELDQTFAPENMRIAVEKFYRAGRPDSDLQDWIDRVYRPYLSIFKTSATVGRGPGFHIRNAVGAAWNNYLLDVTAADHALSAKIERARIWAGRKARNELVEETARLRGISKRQARREVSDDAIAERAEVLIKQRLEKEKFGDRTLWDVHVAAIDNQVGWRQGEQSTLSEQQAIGERLGPDASPAERLRAGRREFLFHAPEGEELSVAQRVANRIADMWWVRANGSVAQRTESFFRDAAFIQGLRRYGWADGGETAALLPKAAQFDYHDLSDFESRALRGFALPFYTWTRNNIPLQFRALMTEPGKVNRLFNAMGAAQEQFGADDQEYVPEWMKDRLGFITRWAPGGLPFILGAESPVTQLNEFFKGDSPVDAAQNFGEALVSGASPVIKGPLEFAVGKDFFTGADLSELSSREAPWWYRILPDAIAPSWSQDGKVRGDARIIQGLGSAVPWLSQATKLAGLAGAGTQEQVGRFPSELVRQAFPVVSAATLTPEQEAGMLYARMDRIAALLKRHPEQMELVRFYMDAGVPVEQIAAILEAQQ